MRVVGQVGAAYIIAEGPEGLYLIDQHAAHERILYEQLLAQWRQRHVASQGLVAPATVYLSPSQADLVEEHAALLAGLGFDVEPFGPGAFQVRAVPALLGRADPAAALSAVVADLESAATPLQAQLEALVLRRVCKSAAVKAGQTLSREEMEALIVQLEACETPHTCPHGRPTLIHLSAAALARQFGRT
jgi:DNA mismatch repair protein MutL